jgi:acyl carrier protein
MNEESILKKLNTIFCDVLDDDDIALNAQTTAEDIEDWDSLSHINLISSIEDEYTVNFALGELQDLKNVGDMCKLVLQKKTQ